MLIASNFYEVGIRLTTSGRVEDKCEGLSKYTEFEEKHSRNALSKILYGFFGYSRDSYHDCFWIVD